MTNPHHPQLFGFVSYSDWLNKAAREFRRFNAATDPKDRIDHVFNFCTSIGQAIEWAFKQNVKDQPKWTTVNDLGAFRNWLKKHCRPIGQIETVYMAAKHPRLTSYTPTGDGGSASASGVTLNALPFNAPAFVSATEGALIDDVRHLVAGGIIVATEVSYTVENLYAPDGKVRFHMAAEQVLKVWRQFDPAKGETQTFVI